MIRLMVLLNLLVTAQAVAADRANCKINTQTLHSSGKKEVVIEEFVVASRNECRLTAEKKRESTESTHPKQVSFGFRAAVDSTGAMDVAPENQTLASEIRANVQLEQLGPPEPLSDESPSQTEMEETVASMGPFKSVLP